MEEEVKEMETHIPTVVNGAHAFDGHRTQDVLIHSNQTALNATFLNESVSRNSKENAVAIVENRVTLENLRSELICMIKEESLRTRELMQTNELRRLENDNLYLRLKADKAVTLPV